MNLAELEATEAREFKPYHKGHTSRDAAHLEFIAWDGEGITPEGQAKQNFVLFGNSKGFSTSSDRLSSLDCLNLIINTELEHSNAIHVGFAFSYDVEMILADVPIKQMSILRKKGYVMWKGFRIEYRKGKWFQVGKRVGSNKVSCRIWDVFSFFGTSFLVAIEEYLGSDLPELAPIKEGKDSRRTFTYPDVDSFIIPYWKMELDLTVRLMQALRERLYGAGLKIRQWHGPGAIATYAMRDKHTALSMDKNIPTDVNNAAQYAYAGGRFELFKLGRERNGVYAYDIRSAYPSAITQLPNLSQGYWEYQERPTRIARFGVYHIKFANKSFFTPRPMPYFYRDARHTIHFPNITEGWYWSPEAELATSLGNDATILEGWVFHDDGSRPFMWVEEVYEKRAEWKRNGNPSQIALKLLLNSMYGKFAQRVGWERAGGPPTWHQLEWAGYVTSHARAKLFRAMVEAFKTNDLIGVETDGIFSRRELPLQLGQSLGQWDCDYYEEMIYLQSGFYFKKQEGEWKAKYRGFDRGTITVNDAENALALWTPWDGESRGSLTGTTTRFATFGAYLQKSDPESARNVWETSPRTLTLGQDGKRIHRAIACKACADKISPNDCLHDLTVTYPVGGLSAKHVIPWLNNTENPFRSYIEREDHA